MTGVGVDHCRVVPPGVEASPLERIQFLRHFFAYVVAAERLAQRAKVLEIGTGEGYGAAMLVAQGHHVTGLDLSPQALRHAAETYPGLHLCIANGSNLPFANHTYDAIVSFQVIEHVSQVSDYLREAGRVLAAHGTLILTTPNRRLRLLPFQKPWNPYHIREYAAHELRGVLQQHFRLVEVLGITASEAILTLERARVRQSAPRVYGRMLLTWLRRKLGRTAARSYSSLPGISSPVRHAPAIIGERTELSDFFLAPKTSRCLDLFAIASQPYQNNLAHNKE